MPEKVEEKIRYLLRKFPHTEWSGVLFYKHTGSFENGNLEIHCEDIYPMDLGNATFTQFKMDESVTSYIADNIDLFDCDLGLVHSHHTMSTTFSGTDTDTLREEGNDRNCFVSLIVNHAGTYSAAITRKIQTSTEVTTKSLGTSYEFFGEGTITTDADPMSKSTRVIDNGIIEYFMLDVTREETNNPLDYLDARFEEIEAKKKQAVPQRPYVPSKGDTIPTPMSQVNSLRDSEEDKEFFDWLHSGRNKSAGAKEALYSQPSLFGEEVMEELVDADKWQPDPKVIHHLACQLLTCSLIVNKDIDLKQWVKVHMQKKYDEIFSGNANSEFDMWSDSYVEFIVQHYSDENVPIDVYEDWDTYQGKVAEALLDELEKFPLNEYIETYLNILNRYLV